MPHEASPDPAPASSAGTPTIEVTVNGEHRCLAEGTSLVALLREAGRDPRTVAVEHNGDILARARFADLVLAHGDRLEIVHFVQGG